jgi:hypothetical protein
MMTYIENFLAEKFNVPIKVNFSKGFNYVCPVSLFYDGLIFDVIHESLNYEIESRTVF